MRCIRAVALTSAILFGLGLVTACDAGDDTGDDSPSEDVSGFDVPDGIIGGDVPAGDVPVGDGTDLPEPDYDIGDLATLALCGDMCTDVMEGCLDHPFESQEACEEACRADLDADGKNLSNWQCAVMTCDGDMCGFDEGGIADQIEPNPDCVETCGLVDACNAWDALTLPPNEIAICIGSCTGSSIGMEVNPDPSAPSFDEILNCIRDSLKDECNLEDATMCVSDGGEAPPPEQQAMWCEQVCSEVSTNPEGELYCPLETGLGQAYEDPTPCIEACNAGDWWNALRWWGCVLTNECGDPQHCHELTDGNSLACEGFCSAQAEVCPMTSEGPQDPDQCASFCTGFEANMGPFPDDAGACVEEKLTEDMCMDQETVDGVAWGCLFAAGPECELICASADACIPDDAKEGPEGWSVEQCEQACAFGALGDTEGIAACVDEAGMDCAAVFACFPEEEGPLDVPPEMVQAGCASACADIASVCDDGTDVGECAAECIGLASEDPYWIGNYICWAQSCDMEMCAIGVAPSLPVPGCADACGALDDCDLLEIFDLPEDQPGFCEAGCAGSAAANPMLPLALDCITETTQETCDPEAVMMCLGEPGEPPALDAAGICTFACGILDGDPDDPENNGCEADSPAKQEMPDFLKCMEGCTMTNDPAQAMAALGCLATSGCGYVGGTVQHCIDFPHDTVDSCADSCVIMGSLCEEVGGGPDLCPALCSGATQNIPELKDDGDIAQCMDDIDTCEEDGFGQILECQMAMPEFCDDLCGDVGTCGLDEDDWCYGTCAWGYLGADEDDALPQCIDDADEDCESISVCLNADKEDDGGP